MEVDCPRCDNAGVIFVPRQRQEKDSNGNTITRTVEVEEKCPTCKGRGKIESSGSR